MDQRARRILAFSHTTQDRLHLGITHRHRTALRPQEPGDPVNRVDEVIALVRHLHPHQNVARHEATLCRHLLTAADLDHFLGRNEHFFDLVLKPLLLDRLQDLLRDLLLEIRENADRVPPLRHLVTNLFIGAAETPSDF